MATQWSECEGERREGRERERGRGTEADAEEQDRGARVFCDDFCWSRRAFGRFLG
jgi:hypothetical protein